MSFASFFTRLVDNTKDQDQDRNRDKALLQSVEAQQVGRRGSLGGSGPGGGQGLVNRRSSFSKMADATEEGFGRAADALGSFWGSVAAAPTYNPLGSTVTFLSEDDVVDGALRVLARAKGAARA